MRNLGIILLLVAGLFRGSLLAQSQAATADLLGTVKDASDAVLPGVEMTARNTATGFTRIGISDERGSYRIPLLPPGGYQIRAELVGFQAQMIEGVVLTVGQSANLNIVLQVSEVTSEIVVVTNVGIVETQKTVQSSTISAVEIANLPINERNFLNFALLTPGVGDKSVFHEEVVQAPTSGLSFGGQDQRSNYVTVDGADNTDSVAGSVRSTLSQDAVQEFQINRNTFSAEFGRARGGVINIVSKSGTNSLHGNAFFFWRSDSFDATNTFAKSAPTDPPFERLQLGATIGGPIVKDQTFFFASFERLDRKESLFVNFLDDLSIFRPTASQQQLFDFLASTGVPPLTFLSAALTDPRFGVLHTLPTNFPNTLALFERESGIFPFSAESDTFSLKVDHQFNLTNNLSARFNINDSFNDNARFGALEGVSNGVKYDRQDWALVVSDTHIFSPHTLNDVKFQAARRSFTVLTNDARGPQIDISGVAEFGREFFNPTSYDINIFQVTENMTFIRGRHTFKAGVDFDLTDLDGFAEVFLGGGFTFGERIPLAGILDQQLGPGTTAGLIRQLSTPNAAGGLGRPDLVPNLLAPISAVQSFNFGLPITFLQGFGDPRASFVYPQVALYFQDAWQLRENLTLNLGLRYDTDWRIETSNVINTSAPFQFQTSPLNDHNNVAPRLGFAWDPGNNGKTVIRGGYGIFYQNYVQAIAFISQVLSGKVSQVFLPITGLPGITSTTSADAWTSVCPGGICADGVGGQAFLEARSITPGTTPAVILPAAADMTTPYSHQASLSIERSLRPDLALGIDYSLNRGVHLIRSRDINFRKVGDNQFAGRGADPRFTQINMVESGGSSIYHAVATSLRKRFSRGYSFNLSYTFAKAIDDTTDFISSLQPNDQSLLSAERSLSSFHQAHRLVVSGVWQSPYQAGSGQGFATNFLADWTVSPIIIASSGKPFNVINGFDRNNDTHNGTDRPLLDDGSQVGRNTGRGPNFSTIDLRVSRKFRLPREETYFELLLEAFNLLNRVNYSGINTVVGAMTLPTTRVQGSSSIPANRPLGFTSAFNPRQIQFGLRLIF